MGALSKFANITSEPYYSRLKKWKENSRNKVIGCFGLYVPEEMLHALGIFPVILFDGPEPITIGSRHWQSYTCGPVRGITDLTCKGQLDFLDGMVIHDCCHVIRGSVDILKLNVHNISYIKPMWFPKMLKHRQTKPRVIEELNIFRESLQELTGQQMTVQSLQRSIQVYNENRNLLIQLYDIRRRKPGVLSAKQVQQVVLAGMQMPKEEHNELVKELLIEVQSEEVAEDDRAKIVLSGSLCDEVPEDILNIIEDVGGVVVDDDLYVGSRYFLSEVPSMADPIEALAERYVNMIVPCPTTEDPSNDLAEYLLNVAKRSRADGIINIITKFCEPHCHIYPWIRYACRDAGIPELLVETEREITSFASIRTRIQTFVELIKGG